MRSGDDGALGGHPGRHVPGRSSAEAWDAILVETPGSQGRSSNRRGPRGDGVRVACNGVERRPGGPGGSERLRCYPLLDALGALHLTAGMWVE